MISFERHSGVHPPKPMMHIAYSPLFPQNVRISPLFLQNLRFLGLIYIILLPSLFWPWCIYVLHVVDAPGAPSCRLRVLVSQLRCATLFPQPITVVDPRLESRPVSVSCMLHILKPSGFWFFVLVSGHWALPVVSFVTLRYCCGIDNSCSLAMALMLA